MELPQRNALFQSLALSVLVLAIEYLRVIASRYPAWQLLTLLLGGGALALIGLSRSRTELGLAGGQWLERGIGGIALAIVLLLPAEVRWSGGPHLGVMWSVAAIAVSLGEEVAFRGILFSVWQAVLGGPLAVVATTFIWTAAHILSHPPAFLVVVAFTGLLLGIWRWLMDDLVAPIIAHTMADLLL